MFSKYQALIRIQWENGLVYRLNFVMWRVRNILQMLTVYFFWLAVGQSQTEAFGYQDRQIFTYLFGVLILRSLVLSSRTVDVGWDILDSSLSQKLIKPMGYLKYWFAADIADKTQNVIFALGEFLVLILILKPPLLFQKDIKFLATFGLAVTLAFFLYFFLNFALGLVAFWTHEVWAPRFIFMILLDFLAGGLFPIDIWPQKVYTVIKLTPFPYLLYFPMEVYLARIKLATLFGGLIISFVWTVLMIWLATQVWRRGLRRYEAFGG